MAIDDHPQALRGVSKAEYDARYSQSYILGVHAFSTYMPAGILKKQFFKNLS
jgi:hypothetical protein